MPAWPSWAAVSHLRVFECNLACLDFCVSLGLVGCQPFEECPADDRPALTTVIPDKRYAAFTVSKIASAGAGRRSYWSHAILGPLQRIVLCVMPGISPARITSSRTGSAAAMRPAASRSHALTTPLKTRADRRSSPADNSRLLSMTSVNEGETELLECCLASEAAVGASTINCNINAPHGKLRPAARCRLVLCKTGMRPHCRGRLSYRMLRFCSPGREQ